ncbi:hypothetical protein QBZ16_004685 [Prototheca wickerhamii]|uniref:Uncharacterized protein n=1 Tax=Prototheca wickerhamii TaxID=3111 RepID=A0AAD9MI53_PROWI|nr:hypothetical protein QBZ16_004685 [Prototheca wickerhamii]
MDVAWVYLVLGVAYLGWIIFLSGLASVQARCGKESLNNSNAGYLGVAPCSTVWFQLGVIIACTVYVLQGLDRLRSALMSYLTITTTLTMSSANTYVYFNDAPEVQGHSATQATAAGAVISSIANLCLILCMALYEEQEIIGPKPMAQPKSSIPSAVI